MNRQLFLYAALCFLLPISKGFAQQGVEPLKQKLGQQTTELGRMHVKLEIGDAFMPQNADSSLFWYNSVLLVDPLDAAKYAQWAASADNPTKYYNAVALGRSGIIMLKKGSLQEAFSRLDAAIDLAKEVQQPELALYCSDNAAVELAQKGEYEASLRYFERSLEFYQSLNNTQGIAFCLGNLGAINVTIGALYKASNYYEQLLEMQGGVAKTEEGLRELLNIAQLNQKLEDYKKSNTYLEQALALLQEMGYNEPLGQIYSMLGSNMFKMGKLEESGEYYGKLSELASRTNDTRLEMLACQNLGTIEYAQNRLSQSIQFWEKTYTLALEMSNGPVVLESLLNLSTIYNELNNYDKAAEYYDRYIAVGKQMGDTQLLAGAHLKMGQALVKAGRLENAREHFGHALELFNQRNDANGIAQANNAMGRLLILEQRFQQALEFFDANIDGGSDVEKRIIAESLQGKAEALRWQAQYPPALRLFVQALALREEINDVEQALVCLNSLGALYEVTGNIPKSIESYERALRMAVEQGNREGESAIYNNLGIVYRRLGDFDKARDSYEKALKIFLESDNAEAASYAYNNLGIVYENLGDYNKANEFYEKSLQIKESAQDKLGLATSLLNIGNVYKYLKNSTKAQEAYQQSLSLSEEISDKQGMALALGSLASLAIEEKNYDEAIEFADKSLAIAQEIDLQSAIKESYRQKGWAYTQMGITEWAEEAYLQLIEMNYADINRNFTILSESEKELFYKTLALDFDRFYSFSLKRQLQNPSITQHVYNSMLKNKGLLLKSSTAMRNAILSSGNSQLIESFERWVALRQEIAKLYALPVEERKTSPVELEKQANDIEKVLVRGSSEFGDFDKMMQITWADIVEHLSKGEAAIEFTHFVHTPDSILYCALVLLPGWDAPKMVPLFEQRQLVRIIGDHGGNNLQYVNNIYGKLDGPSTKLYELIWKPLETTLKGISKVFYAPTGLLHKISFAALAKDSQTLLIDEYDLCLLGGTSQIAIGEGSSLGSDATISLFGGIAYSTLPEVPDTWTYLKGTLEETTMLEKLLNFQLASVSVFTDTVATEARFREAATTSDILHIATHGFFFPDPQEVEIQMEAVTEYGEVEFRGGARNHGLTSFVRNQNPLMRSGLVFAGVNDFWNSAKPVITDDGVLTALEVINIDMRRNQLVVLSACETGLGEISGSEGVYGLQRAFKMAGCKDIVMSLWQVPDKETAEFMGFFYKEYLETKNLRSAFLATQKFMRSQYDPYFWAAFVLLE